MREKRGMTQDISTHTLTWSVTSVYKSLWSAWIISTHTLTWSVTSGAPRRSRSGRFQLTRSRGAWRHKCIYPYWQIFKFQLTRSRGAWHSCKNTLSAFPISTHTLTWSVTLLVISLIGITGFQLTRSRGAWLKCFLILWISSAFQLTRSRGAWHARSGSISIKTAISTHTLTWSVTAVLSLIGTFIGFQLTRSRGAWRQIWAVGYGLVEFQLTRSRGAWLLSSEYIYFYNDFNSHAHVERDPCGDLQQRYVENFNSHAHVERDLFSCSACRP